jgi:CHAT domain-containing protein
MIDFYKNLLEAKQEKQEFSQALQQAKLKMIDEGKYAHPFYWSPFILIGK